MQTDQGYLTYCTNIHPGENWSDHFAALQQNFPSIKAQVSPDILMGIGLRLSHQASEELQHADNLTELKQWLSANKAYVFTMNGFPYGEFHNTAVKDQVHAPDWTTHERLDYTLRLFGILKQLLPGGMEGGISTSPLSYRYWHNTPELLKKATDVATANILKVAKELISIDHQSGIFMHLDIEPEPDGIIENGPEYITWYTQVLLPQGKPLIAETFGVTHDEAERLLKRHICLCYDVCHFAIGYEPHQQIIAELEEKGLKVGKIQISAALKAALPSDTKSRKPILDTFEKFNEPTYLHQVIAKTQNGQLLRYRDLPDALNDGANAAVDQWRAHFHVPIFTEELGLLQSTQSDIVEVLQINKNKRFSQHLEVETYTWGVLPDEKKLPINDSIARELNWVKDIL
ncbi:metabolite traffic protein EboE [Mucilaginibacter calamicampi]|uniref:Metabolite traffic protein EboE n=1 Tax=Mucilaginibacter calamicampi TaxID=1302352 RepID=A0ABW2Z0K9_9SPHI